MMKLTLVFALAFVALSRAQLDLVTEHLTSFVNENASPCDQCMTLTKHLNSLLVNEQFKALCTRSIDEYCDSLPVVEFEKIMCKMSANAFIPKMLKRIEADHLAPYCTATTCDATKKFTLCGFVQNIRNQVSDLTDTLTNLCTDLPQKMQAGCMKIVAKVIPPIQKVLVSVANMVIKILKCTTESNVMNAAAVGGNSNVKCEACNDGIKLLNDLLESPLVKGSLTKLLQALCLDLPPLYVQGCVVTIQTTMDDVVKFITDMTDHICPDLVKCAEPSFKLSEATESKTCNGLQSVYNAVPNFVSSLAPVCAVFKNATQATNCMNVFGKDVAGVAKYGQKVLAWTAAHLVVVPECHLVDANGKPEQVVDVASLPNPEPAVRPLRTDEIQCQACDDAVSFLNYLLGSPFVEGSLKTLLSGLCNELPKDYAAGCSATVAGSLDQIVKFIGDMDGHICPGALGCASLPRPVGMEHPKRRHFNHLLLRPSHVTSNTNDLCDAFQKIFNYVPQMTPQLAGVCDVIPAQYQAGCKSFFVSDSAAVTHMAQEAVEWVANEVPFAHCKVGPSA